LSDLGQLTRRIQSAKERLAFAHRCVREIEEDGGSGEDRDAALEAAKRTERKAMGDLQPLLLEFLDEAGQEFPLGALASLLSSV
jgi:hypothetical protein